MNKYNFVYIFDPSLVLDLQVVFWKQLYGHDICQRKAELKEALDYYPFQIKENGATLNEPHCSIKIQQRCQNMLTPLSQFMNQIRQSCAIWLTSSRMQRQTPNSFWYLNKQNNRCSLPSILIHCFFGDMIFFVMDFKKMF